MSQTVLQWAGLYQQASQETGIPASVLAGLVQIESGGRPGLTSSANAQGITQFIPGTAREYGVDVRPGHERSQVFGAARYLKALGFDQDPKKALASYNAGPGNFRAGLGYADNVLAASKSYRQLDGAAGALTPAPEAAPASSSSSGGLLNSDRKRGLLSGLLWLGLVGLGVTLATLGAARLTGARSAATTLAQAIPATRAAKAVTPTAKAKAT